jgi:hypothetical protein
VARAVAEIYASFRGVDAPRFVVKDYPKAPSPPTTSAAAATHSAAPPAPATAPNVALTAKTTGATAASDGRSTPTDTSPAAGSPDTSGHPTVVAAELDFPVRVHELRHAHVSWLLAGGGDIHVVKERLVHGSLRTTEKYRHTLPDDADGTALDALRLTRMRTVR